MPESQLTRGPGRDVAYRGPLRALKPAGHLAPQSHCICCSICPRGAPTGAGGLLARVGTNYKPVH